MPKEDEQADLQRADTLLAGLEGVVDRVGRVVGMGHEQSVAESLDPGRVAVPSRPVAVIPVRVVMPVFMVMVVSDRRLVFVPVVGDDRRLGVGVIVRLGAAHDASVPCRWWRGVPPSECSAWEIASETSCEACSFSSR